MAKMKQITIYFLLYSSLALLAGCSTDESSTSSSYSYSTTSSRGDYSEWTLSDSSLNATWNVVTDTGAIDFTYSFSATCGTADSFGVRNCTTDTSSCTDGVSACSDSFPATFDIMDVPGVALYVNTGSGASAQLHIGFAKDSTACTQDVSGDYTMIRTALGLDENFGLYRSDATFINLTHADFGFATTDANVANQSVVYRTGGGTGTGLDALIDAGCVDGVRTRTLGTDTIRSMMTASGLFVLDLPAGQGGMISFKTSNAAVLADFAGKSFGGIVFPDQGALSEPLIADFGAVSDNQVSLTSTVGSQAPEMLSIKSVATASTPAPAGPDYPDFTTAPAGYASNALSGAYTSPAAIPGLFKLDDLNDSGRVILAAMKYNGKVIAVGMVYNYRDTSDTNPSTDALFDSAGLYNTGNFILFEK